MPALANGSGIGGSVACAVGNGSGAGATATADFSLASKFEIALSRGIRCPNGMPSFSKMGLGQLRENINVDLILAEHAS